MNKVILMGRPTKDPEVRRGQGDNPTAVARYTLAVDRKYKRDGEQSADFISCVAFGKAAEFAEKYIKQGIKIAVTGSIRTGSYTNKDGNKVYTTDIVVEEHEFAESKGGSRSNNNSNNVSPGQQDSKEPYTDEEGYMHMRDGIDEELPFN